MPLFGTEHACKQLMKRPWVLLRVAVWWIQYVKIIPCGKTKENENHKCLDQDYSTVVLNWQMCLSLLYFLCNLPYFLTIMYFLVSPFYIYFVFCPSIPGPCSPTRSLDQWCNHKRLESAAAWLAYTVYSIYFMQDTLAIHLLDLSIKILDIMRCHRFWKKCFCFIFKPQCWIKKKIPKKKGCQCCVL